VTEAAPCVVDHLEPRPRRVARHLRRPDAGPVDRVDGVVRFTHLHLQARLALPAGGDVERAKRLLEKAEKACLVTNSLALEPTLTMEVSCA
jgi:organic hydroperoxide reductase OsmC/OhrA